MLGGGEWDCRCLVIMPVIRFVHQRDSACGEVVEVAE